MPVFVFIIPMRVFNERRGKLTGPCLLGPPCRWVRVENRVRSRQMLMKEWRQPCFAPVTQMAHRHDLVVSGVLQYEPNMRIQALPNIVHRAGEYVQLVLRPPSHWQNKSVDPQARSPSVQEPGGASPTFEAKTRSSLAKKRCWTSTSRRAAGCCPLRDRQALLSHHPHRFLHA